MGKKQIFKFFGIIIGVCLLGTTISTEVMGFGKETDYVMLITEEEAALPDARGPLRELKEGPEVRIESPENHGVYVEPFPITVLFMVGPKGFDVDMETLKVTYKKLWGIDITSRVRKHINNNALNVPQSKLPVGKHTIEIYIEDVKQNPSSKWFTITVKKST